MSVDDLIRWMRDLRCPTAEVRVRPADYEGDPLRVSSVSGGLAGGLIIETEDAHVGNVSEMEDEVSHLEEKVKRLERVEEWAEKAYDTLQDHEGDWVDNLIDGFPA